MLRTYIAIILCLPLAALPQKLTLGVAAGTSAAGDFKSGTYFFPGGTSLDGPSFSSSHTVLPDSRRLVIGPKLELKLPGDFSLEAHALHRPLESGQFLTTYVNGVSQFNASHYRQTNASWEFPVLLKYGAPGLPLHPLFEGGPSPRLAGSDTLAHWGATAGAGVETHVRGIEIA